MAEIPVERKSGGVPWWVWLLLAAIVIALLIWWATDDDEVETTAAEPVAIEQMAPVGADGATMNQAGPVTDMAMLMPTISEDMVGRQVQLDGVQIQEVVGDIGFWIGPSAEQRIFAVLTQEPTPGTPMEGEADVNTGATANVTGTIRTRGEILSGFAQGEVANLPQGVDRFLVIDNYQIAGSGQNQ